MTNQGPQLTPPGGVHLLRLPGGVRLGDAAEPASPGQSALNPFSGPGPVAPAAPAPPAPQASDWSLTVLALVILLACVGALLRELLR